MGFTQKELDFYELFLKAYYYSQCFNNQGNSSLKTLKTLKKPKPP